MRTLDIGDVHPGASRRRARRAVRISALLGVAVLCGLLVAARAWFFGGTRLTMAGAGLGVHPVAVGRAVSFGVPLSTRGGSSVTVQSATATRSANVALQFAIIRTGPGEIGIGTADGRVRGSTPLGAHGIRVSQAAPADGATWLVVTVTARRPGPWSVTHITLTYRSWWRTRTATSGYVVNGPASPA